MSKMADYAHQEYLENSNEANSLLDFNRNRANLQSKMDSFHKELDKALINYMLIFVSVFLMNIAPFL